MTEKKTDTKARSTPKRQRLYPAEKKASSKRHLRLETGKTHSLSNTTPSANLKYEDPTPLQLDHGGSLPCQQRHGGHGRPWWTL